MRGDKKSCRTCSAASATDEGGFGFSFREAESEQGASMLHTG